MTFGIMADASAPAKIIFSGEHSVVYGQPALAIAINLRCHVKITKDGEGLLITSKNYIQKYYYSTAKLENVLSGKIINSKLDNIAMAVLTVFKPNEISHKLEINSEIPIGAGLGSSAAVAVATVTAALKIKGQKYDSKIISDKAFICERIAHGNPSGIDNLISTYGGIVRFQNGNMIKLDLEYEIPIIIIDTKIPKETKKMVELVKKNWKSNPEKYNDIFNKMGTLTSKIEKELLNNNLENIGNLMLENQKFLEKIGVGIPNIEKLTSNLSKLNTFGYKITGAGGGGAIIVLMKNGDTKEAIKIVETLGYDVYETKITNLGVN